MNYIIINHYATTPYLVGGTRHYDMAQELISEGHIVTIIASSYNHFSKKETIDYGTLPFENEIIDGINFIWIKTRAYTNGFSRIKNMLDFYINGIKMIKKNNNIIKPDIIIGSTVHPLAVQLAIKMAKKYKAKFYFEERDFWPQTFVDFGKMNKRNPIALVLYQYEKYFYKKAQKIIVLFPKAHEYLKFKNVPEEKIIYLPNGYSNHTKVNDTENNIDMNLFDIPTVTYIGSHGIANNLQSILELAKVCNDLNLRFLFIGDGNEKFNLIQKSKEMDLKNVLFLNTINKDQVQDYLAQSMFTIISIKDSPLYKYGFSMNKIYDYLNSNKPMIMLAPLELCEEYITKGVIISENYNEIRNELINYLNDDDKYMRDCENISQFKTKFAWSNLINNLLGE